MNLCVINQTTHPEDVRPNIVLPYAEVNGTSAVLDAVKLNLPTMVKMERSFSYDLLFRKLWADGKPFIIVEHDIIPWPGALVEMWKCPEPWCGFPYFVFGMLRSYLGCTKFDPARLGECPLSGELLEWQRIDKKIEAQFLMRGHKGHLHSPAVTHLNINHSRMRDNVMINPYFWESVNVQ